MIAVGDKVMVVAEDAFFAYIDGWRGSVRGFTSGLAEVVVIDEESVDGHFEKVFFIPPGQLAHTV